MTTLQVVMAGFLEVLDELFGAWLDMEVERLQGMHPNYSFQRVMEDALHNCEELVLSVTDLILHQDFDDE